MENKTEALLVDYLKAQTKTTGFFDAKTQSKKQFKIIEGLLKDILNELRRHQK